MVPLRGAARSLRGWCPGLRGCLRRAGDRPRRRNTAGGRAGRICQPRSAV